MSQYAVPSARYTAVRTSHVLHLILCSVVHFTMSLLVYVTPVGTCVLPHRSLAAERQQILSTD